MDNGWVKLHRQLFDNPIWLAEKFTKGQAWVDLFSNANHKDGSFWVRGNEVKLKRGQIGWSEITMAKRWRWSRNKVRRFLKWLETEQQIEQQKTTITSIITILNYDRYQTFEQKTEQQKDSRRNTNNNVKNDKKPLGGKFIHKPDGYLMTKLGETWRVKTPEGWKDFAGDEKDIITRNN